VALGREKIYSAFYAQIAALLLAPAGPFMYGGRRPVPPSGLGQYQYPAFFFMESGEIYDRTVLRAPARVSLLATLSIHSVLGDIHDESSVPQLNNLADAVEDAIQGACQPTCQLILGGLVQQAWINHRQMVITGSYPQQSSVQNMGIEIVLPHSR
jgi:hypothetical protein